MNAGPTTLAWGTLGDAAHHAWFTFLLQGDGGMALLGDGGGAAPPAIVEVRAGAATSAEAWRLSGPGIDVEVGQIAACVTTAEELEVEHCLSRATGEVRVGEREMELDARGVCASASGLDSAQLDSLRTLCAWFDEGASYSLAAARPRRAKGQDRDHVLAVLLDDPAASPFADPRLSTTYGANGSPLRAGLELWLDEEEDDEDTLPHRAAGESLAPAVSLRARAFAAEVAPFQWHSRGREGFGSYGLVRPR